MSKKEKKYKIMEWKCPECGKIIASTSKRQEEFNIKQHLEKHRREENERRRKNK